LASNALQGEIIISDNGSTDDSVKIAESMGARVIRVQTRGYGNALLAGIQAARGRYVIMGDSDDSYDFQSLNAFLEKLQAGYDLVVGNRFRGGIKEKAMPSLHRYFGNPVLSLIGRMLYRSPVNDFYCGLRGFRREAILDLGLTCPGMEFALEMIVKSSIHGLRITEVPTTLSPDGRGGRSHLRWWRDGWRSLRLYLLLSPEGLFLYPGLVIMVLSAMASVALIFTNIQVGSVTFAHHTLIMTSVLTVIGIQSIFFWLFSRYIAIEKRLLFPDPIYEKLLSFLKLENCLVVGGILVGVGLVMLSYALVYWYDLQFGKIEDIALIKVVCAASFLLATGTQIVFSSFFLYLLKQNPKVGPDVCVDTRAGPPR
jgi:glycosyltransferase involved in cell wall biosynthesis